MITEHQVLYRYPSIVENSVSMRQAIAIFLASMFIVLPLNFSSEWEDEAFGPILTPPNPEVYGSMPAPQFKEYPRTRGTRSDGTEELLVILIEFSDVSHQGGNTQAKYQTMMFSTNPSDNSMHNYYDEVSYGNLNIVGNSTSWYQSARTMSYYGADSPTGVDDANGPIYRLVTEAVQIADSDVDFSLYDNDGDGMVDHLAVVHAGQGQESSLNTNTIWSHRWAVLDADTSTPGNQQLIVDGVQVYWYTMQSEYSPVGVFAHEFGHDLGLIDLYDIGGDSEGIGSWGLMGQGAWLGSPAGSTPAHPCAWAKVELGWVIPFEVLTPLADEAIQAVETSAAIYKLPIGGTAAGEEYFLIENRQQIGFDSGLPGSGLLIWHVDETMDDNDDQFHRKVDLEEADEELGENPTQSSDPWSDSVDGFTPTSIPDSSSYANVRTGWKVRNISPSGSVMTADITREVDDDLAVTAVRVKSIAQVGESLTVTATIENKGTNDKAGFNVTLTVYNNTYETVSDIYNETTIVLSLVSRAETNLTWTYAPTLSGRILFEVVVNLIDDEIPENNDRIVHTIVDGAYFYDDVESGNTIWSTNSGSAAYRWEIVDDSMPNGGSHSPTHSWKFGFFGPAGGLPAQPLYLQSDNISVAGGAPVYLSFFHKYYLGELLEQDGFNVRRTDEARVYISADGDPWEKLEMFEYSQGAWTLWLYDISGNVSSNGSDVRIRFEIDVRLFPKAGGWWIDDIAILQGLPEHGLVLKIYHNTDSVDPGGYAGFLIKLTNVGDILDRFEFRINYLLQGWSAYLSQNASSVDLVQDFEVTLRRDEQVILFLTIETTEDTPRGEKVESILTAVSVGDRTMEDSVTVITEMRLDPLFETLVKVLTWGIILLIVLAVVALIVSHLRGRKYKPKYPGY